MKNVLRGFFLAFLATSLGCLFTFTIPDGIASATGRVLPFWFYQNQVGLGGGIARAGLRQCSVYRSTETHPIHILVSFSLAEHTPDSWDDGAQLLVGCLLPLSLPHVCLGLPSRGVSGGGVVQACQAVSARRV